MCCLEDSCPHQSCTGTTHHPSQCGGGVAWSIGAADSRQTEQPAHCSTDTSETAPGERRPAAMLRQQWCLAQFLATGKFT